MLYARTARVRENGIMPGRDFLTDGHFSDLVSRRYIAPNGRGVDVVNTTV